MRIRQSLFIGMLTLTTALFADDLTSVMGKNWDDRAVRQMFSSNYVRKFSTTVTVDLKNNFTTSNSLYIVSHPSQNTKSFWDECCGYPAEPYIPYIEIRTLSDSRSNQTEVVSSLEVFKSKFGDDLLPSFLESLRLPDRLIDYKQLNSGLGHPGIKVWLWHRAIPESKAPFYADNHPDNGRITYTSGSLNGVVNLWFDKEELYSIQYCRKGADDLSNDYIPTSTTVQNLQFIGFGTPWMISVDTNAVLTLKNSAKKMFDLNLKLCERGRLIHERMLELGYKLDRERRYFGAPISSFSRWYSSRDGAIEIQTSADINVGLFSERVKCVYVDIRIAGGPKNVLLPYQTALPETPDECRKLFKCLYSQESQDGKQLILCCEEGTFLFVENKLTKVSYSQVHNSTKGIYSFDYK